MQVRWTASGPTIYAYVGNDPLGSVDPRGLCNCSMPGTGWDDGYDTSSTSIIDPSYPRPIRSPARVVNQHNEQTKTDCDGTNSAPPVPGDLVGDQSDPRAGPGNSGKRHTSGPLTPENGGTGDAEKDFDKLTGGTGRPFPSSDGRSKIPGAQVGDNGIWIRPGTKSPGDGPRIEIPGNGNKLPETLHY